MLHHHLYTVIQFRANGFNFLWTSGEMKVTTATEIEKTNNTLQLNIRRSCNKLDLIEVKTFGFERTASRRAEIASHYSSIRKPLITITSHYFVNWLQSSSQTFNLWRINTVFLFFQFDPQKQIFVSQKKKKRKK